jgi:hypothetical protein
MATIDFTMDDFRRAMREEIREEIKHEREHTKAIVTKTVTNMLMALWENNLEPAFNGVYGRLDTIEAEIKGLKRVQHKHSAAIIELQALNGT